MCALIYTKLTDKTLILAPREALVRQFNFGDDWTEMRMGMFFTSVAAVGDDTAGPTEILAISSNADRIAVGIKNAATTDLPGFAGSLFLGAITPTGGSDSNSLLDWGYYCGAYGPCAAGYDGTTLVGGAPAQDFPAAMMCGPAAASSGYNGFYALKFVINNRGLSSQTVGMSASSSGGAVSGTDYSASNLRTHMNNDVYSATKTIAWNTGAAARAIPDSYYVRMPFFNSRIRISAIRAIRYAP